ncbi:hypothetical protein AYO38_02770 [bacterium SCGC AG-212-C10]|nr:hypothetical protein AYO38_02770 [bacterium SCGC AG-212-C10]
MFTLLFLHLFDFGTGRTFDLSLSGRPSVRRDIRHLQELAAMSAEDKAATAAAARANESGSVVARLRQALERAS